MKIEFGCGEKPTKKEFKTCDLRNLPLVDFVCPAWDIDKHVPHSSVEEIFSRHFFEHLTFSEGKKVLSVWFDILQPSGVMEMMLPNMDFHINQWLNNKDLDHARAGFWGWQRESDQGEVWDIHKSGYNFNHLSNLLQELKFVNIVSLKKQSSPHLHIKCQKPN
jgi:predicted SAM-dependent methyltransferase